MKGCLSEYELRQTENVIDIKLYGRAHDSKGLEIDLINKLKEYFFEVEYFNIWNKEESYKNKYDVNINSNEIETTSVPENERRTSDNISKSKFELDIFRKSSKSIISILESHPSRQNTDNTESKDPLNNDFDIEEVSDSDLTI